MAQRDVVRVLGVLGMLVALLVAACQTIVPTTPGPASSPATAVTATATPAPVSSPVVAGTGGPPTPSATIPQPSVTGLPVRPDSERVDLAMPVFSNPTRITNPLFPVSSQASVLLLGTVDKLPFRTEVTLLPETRIIDWAGQRVEVLVSQYVAYLDGQIHEVAYDFYAQADDASVWYFGEDVFNFAEGAIVDTHGTWIAGRDGPAAMIMPGNPKVGDVYRPENAPGLVFEEVIVKAVDERLDGPLGPISGGLLVEELHMDGTTEGKTFAPGYGEFYTAGGGDVEALAMGIPTDSANAPLPESLAAMASGSAAILKAAAAKDWPRVASALTELQGAWDTYKAGGVPRLVEPIMSDALKSLADAAAARKAVDTQRAAIAVLRSALDLELRYRPVTEVDLARFDLWLAQLQLDAAAEDLAGVRSDFFSLDYVRDRILASMDATKVAALNLGLEELLGAIGDEDFGSIAESAGSLRATIGG